MRKKQENKNEYDLTDRQIRLLIEIVSQHINVKQPIGSKLLITKTGDNFGSSATVRNDMVLLEKKGLIYKNHKSSGRIPSTEGYKLYNKYTKEVISEKNKQVIDQIFSKRNLTIEEILRKTAVILNQFTDLPSVVTSIKKIERERLKRIDMVDLQDKKFIIFIVTSEGNIIKKIIEFKELKMADDIVTCIRIFNELLIDCQLNELQNEILKITPIVKTKIKQFDYIVRTIIEQLTNSFEEKVDSKVYGSNSIINQPEFSQKYELLNKIFLLFENENIFKQLAYNHSKSGRTMVNYENEIGIDGVSLVSTTFDINNSKHQISVVGPNRMDYEKIKGIMEYIGEQLKKHLNMEITHSEE